MEVSGKQMESVQRIKLVLASPGDVSDERSAVDRVVAELNRGIAKEYSFVIEVLKWETDAYPGFHTGGAQGLIDSVLKIEDSDILVGIFWKRFGTPVSDVEGAETGTEHEIRKAITAWKEKKSPHVMLYFSQTPFMPSSQQELEQMSKVLAFKKEFEKESCYWQYADAQKFESVLREHLTQVLRAKKNSLRAIDSPQTTTSASQTTTSDIEKTRSEYLKFLRERYAKVSLAGMGTSQMSVSLPLEDVYVSLTAEKNWYLSIFPNTNRK